MRRLSERRTTTLLAFVLGVIIATAGTATAAKLITGKQIKDGSIGTKDLAKAVRSQLAKSGVPGATGQAGPKGDAGAIGPKGDVGPQGPGAHSFTISVNRGNDAVLATLDNGVKVTGTCGVGFVQVLVETISGALTLEGSGIIATSSPLTAYPQQVNGDGAGMGFNAGMGYGHLDVVARDKPLGGKLAHVSAGGIWTNTGCSFWGTTTPTT
jgi:hypothetical protein